MSNVEVPAEILALPISDRIEMVTRIWDSIESNAAVEENHEHLEILKERLAAHRADPDSGISWTELKARLLAS